MLKTNYLFLRHSTQRHSTQSLLHSSYSTFSLLHLRCSTFSLLRSVFLRRVALRSIAPSSYGCAIYRLLILQQQKQEEIYIDLLLGIFYSPCCQAADTSNRTTLIKVNLSPLPHLAYDFLWEMSSGFDLFPNDQSHTFREVHLLFSIRFFLFGTCKLEFRKLL